MSYPEKEGRTIANQENTNKKWTRVNLRWKGGQPESSNSPTSKFDSQVKPHYPKSKLIDSKLLKLYLIPFMLESLVNLVSPILECAGM